MLNNNYIILIILLLSILDSSMTWLTMSKYQEKFPERDAINLEKNILTNKICHWLGINIGMFVAGIVSIIILMLGMTYLFTYELKFILIGMLIIVNYLHLINLRSLI